MTENRFKNKILLIFGVVLLLAAQDTLGCDCKEVQKDSTIAVGMRNSNFVFYGKLVSFDTVNYCYKFEIYEIFKGSFPQKFVTGSYHKGAVCEKLPQDLDVWLVYANLIGDTISISDCSPSRSIQDFNKYPPMPPNGHTGVISELKKELGYQELKLKATTDWFIELDQLRLIAGKQKRSVEEESFVKQNIGMIISISTNVIMLLIVLMLLKKLSKKNNTPPASQ